MKSINTITRLRQRKEKSLPPPVLVKNHAGVQAVPYRAKRGITVAASDIPLLLSVPHSGRFYPEDLQNASHLPLIDLRMSEDAFVDDLSEGVIGEGVTQIVATHARAYVDLNRAHNELDPRLFKPSLDPKSVDESLRVKAGLGCIPGVVGPGKSIYAGPLPASEADRRIRDIYVPYHSTLKAHLEARRKKFGMAILIDMHSMPSAPIGQQHKPWPEIVLGDCWGASCDRSITGAAEARLMQAGFSVRRNVPYAGGFACQHYGNPVKVVHVLQIEINRSLYMHEPSLRKKAQFRDVQSRLTSVLCQIAEELSQRPLAAE